MKLGQKTIKKMTKTIKKIWNSIDPKEKSYLTVGLLLIGLFGLVTIIILPWLLTRECISIVDYTQTGAIGDTINGISGPFIALLVAILTFLAFYIQYKANTLQKSQFIVTMRVQRQENEKQNQIWRVERFENKFYELLKLHKDNVNEMNITENIKGRSCFENLFQELRICYLVTNDHVLSNKYDAEYKNINLINFSYGLFFYGISERSDNLFIKDGSEKKLYSEIKNTFKNIQGDVLDSLKKNPSGEKLYYINDNKISYKFKHVPFEGQFNLLGHYYRHLFQTMTFITSQKIINYDEQYGYVKMLRAQISTFEQLLLYYNALAWFDEEWRVFFTEFRLIKNLPLHLADFDKNPEIHFKKEISELKEKGIDMFEWLE